MDHFYCTFLVHTCFFKLENVCLYYNLMENNNQHSLLSFTQ